MRILETQKHTDPTDTDPQHWYLYIFTWRHKRTYHKQFDYIQFYKFQHILYNCYCIVFCYENSFVNKCNIKL